MTTSKTQTEHGTTRSYVIGYMLSLVFTLVPYALVVNKYLTGTVLLTVILGIALLQMLVQIVFFLHLGRGPKPLYNIAFFGATVGIILLTVGGSLFIMGNLYHNMSPDEVTQRLAQEEGIAQIGGSDTGACGELRQNYIVLVGTGRVTPAQVQAKRCDTLTFINESQLTRELVFGAHPVHATYGGHEAITVDASRPESIVLNQAGSYTYHDHNNPQAVGSFVVTER